MNWNKWVRQTHRWLSMAFTAAVIVNLVAVVQGKYTNKLGLLVVAPLALLLFTGLYLFVLPYAANWGAGDAPTERPAGPTDQRFSRSTGSRTSVTRKYFASAG